MDTHLSPSGTVTREVGKKRESDSTRSTKNSKTEIKIERGKLIPIPVTTQKSWNEKYGTKVIKGNKVTLCWYHCNRHGGCKQRSTCPNDHTTLPDKYNGKHYTELT